MNQMTSELFNDLTQHEPIDEDEIIDQSINNKKDSIEKQGADIFKVFRKAKKNKDRKKMLLQMYYLGKLFEEKEEPQRNLSRHKYLSRHYLQVALKTYRIFEEIGPEQIFRTKNLTVTRVHHIPIPMIEQAKDMTNVFEYQPEVENQGRESVTTPFQLPIPQ